MVNVTIFQDVKGIPVPPESLEDMLERVQKEEAADELGIDVEDLSEY